jgi:hypothetical protein
MKPTPKEIARASNAITIVSRPDKQESGGYIVMAVYVDTRLAEGTPAHTAWRIRWAEAEAMLRTGWEP